MNLLQVIVFVIIAAIIYITVHSPETIKNATDTAISTVNKKLIEAHNRNQTQAAIAAYAPYVPIMADAIRLSAANFPISVFVPDIPDWQPVIGNDGIMACRLLVMRMNRSPEPENEASLYEETFRFTKATPHDFYKRNPAPNRVAIWRVSGDTENLYFDFRVVAYPREYNQYEADIRSRKRLGQKAEQRPPTPPDMDY